LNGASISGAGLASASGSLANGAVVLTVTAATANDVNAGNSSVLVVTPNALANSDLKVNSLRFNKSYGVNNQDLNSLTTPGFYYLTGSPVHTPDSGIGYLQVNVYQNTASQFYTNSNTGLSYTRILNANTWSDWTQLVSSTVNVNVGGLATGGGSLSSNVQITVPAATANDVLAGNSATLAVTPYALAQANIAAVNTASFVTNTYATNTFITGVRLGNPTVLSLANVAGEATAPNGCFLTAVNVANGVINGVYYSPLQVEINGSWFTVSG
jgi:hypothetical protein